MANTEIILDGLEGFKKKIERLSGSLFANRLLQEIGMFAMKSIKERTIRGKDVHGESFRDYSPSYSLFRQEKGYQTSTVDLNLTGSMFSSMTYETEIGSVKIFFMNTQDPSGSSNPEKAFYLHEDREFFALSSQDVEGIKDIINDFYFNKLLKGYGI